MIDDFLQDRKVIVLLGSGGVGKTTSSIALAMRAAVQGKRVGLLSIDPAKRLANALGIELGNELREVKFAEGSDGSKIKGSLKAAMLDQQSVFDSMVKKHAPSKKISEKILNHPVYIAASTNLAGPLEYMALAKLRDLAVDPQFDLVVLDTPPDTHALDFLSKPNILAGFFENKVMTWMLKPFSLANKLGLGKLMNAGEKMMGSIAKVAGVSALRSLADFLVLTQEVIEGFNSAGEEIVGILKDDKTSFILVTVPTAPALRSSKNLQLLLSKMNYSCDAVIFNRCQFGGSENLTDIPDDKDVAMEIFRKRILNESIIIKKLKETLVENKQNPPLIITVEEQVDSINTSESLLRFAKSF